MEKLLKCEQYFDVSFTEEQRRLIRELKKDPNRRPPSSRDEDMTVTSGNVDKHTKESTWFIKQSDQILEKLREALPIPFFK